MMSTMMRIMSPNTAVRLFSSRHLGLRSRSCFFDRRIELQNTRSVVDSGRLRFFSQAPAEGSRQRNGGGAGGGGTGGKKSKNDGPMMNEDLIKHIVSINPGIAAREIRVRLVTPDAATSGEPNGESSGKPTASIVSLLKAVETCTELGVDLVAIRLSDSTSSSHDESGIENLPVLKAMDFQKELFAVSKKKRKATVKQNAKKLPVKEVKFKVGIGNNDFMRKVADVIKYLTKGHACQITLKAPLRHLRADPMATDKLLSRMIEEVGPAAQASPKINMNEDKKFGTAVMQPNPKASKA